MRYLITLLLFFSCAHTSKKLLSQKYSITSESKIDLRSFYDVIPNNKKIIHSVTFIGNEQIKSSQVVIVKDKTVKISILSQMGLEVLYIELAKDSSAQITKRVPIKDEFLPRVVADMMTIYTDRSKLTKLITGRMSIIDRPLKRLIKQRDVIVAEVSYTNENHWMGEVTYVNKYYNYKLEVRSLLFESL